MEGKEKAPFRPPNPALPYREDCWSEGETSTLIDAWGNRYIELNRGNLRQKQWQEVADAVNSRPCDARRPPRTDVQCKNRIDTVKKKYKMEKAKIAASDGSLSSQWLFYNRLDALIGSPVPPKKPPPPSSSPPLALPLPSHHKGFPLPIAAAVHPMEAREKRHKENPSANDSSFRRNYTAAAAAAAAAAEGDDSGSSSRSFRWNKERSGRGLRRRRDGEEDGIRELSWAILRLAEIYEKVEGEKQRQMMELEKQRMEFAKGLEFQRMQIFVDSQVQLEKIKRARRTDAGEERSSAVLPFLLQPVAFNM